MDIMSVITENAIQIIPALWVVGKIIKETEFVKDKYIPGLLLIISIGITPAVLGGFTPENIVQAALVAGATVFTNEFIKQGNKKE